MTKVMLEAI